jgi:glycosyltransferase involved in cell wall biosynthesis
MAVHNGRDCLPQAIASLRAQTLEAWELILVDDGSTDGVEEVIRELARLDPRIVVLRNATQRGLAHSLNLAASHARAPLIARLDADDVAFPQRLARQVEFFTGHPDVDVLGTGAELVDESGVTVGTVRPLENHEDLQRMRYRLTPVMHPSVMMRRRVLQQLGGYEERLHRAQDVDLWLRAFRAGFRFHNLPEPLIRYRVRLKPTLKSTLYVTLVYMRAGWAEGRMARYGWSALWHLTARLVMKAGLHTPRTLRPGGPRDS